MKAKVVEFSITPFKTAKDWEKWLRMHHKKSSGIWMRYYKKGSGVATVTYAEALDVALCFGWIDSQAKRFDATSYLQKWTPRKPKSVWSKNNRLHVMRLMKKRRMRAAGLAAIALAKSDGRWDNAYDSPRNMTAPADFLKALNSDKKAKAFYATLNKANTYAIAWRIHHAKKPETRARKIAEFVAMLARREKLD